MYISCKVYDLKDNDVMIGVNDLVPTNSRVVILYDVIIKTLNH